MIFYRFLLVFSHNSERMYLHVGKSIAVSVKDIVGVFDMDNASWSRMTRAFLERAEKRGQMISATDELPKSFIVCQKGKGSQTVYLSQLSPATLKGRLEQGELEL